MNCRNCELTNNNGQFYEARPPAKSKRHKKRRENVFINTYNGEREREREMQRQRERERDRQRQRGRERRVGEVLGRFIQLGHCPS